MGGIVGAVTRRPLILFAHGAGAPSSHPWMRAWANRLASLGDVVTFDYPYMNEGRRRPDPHARLVAAHREVLARTRTGHAGPVVLAGKSMGSRIGCHLALEESAAALVCFGYPLVSPGKRRSVRDAVLLEQRTPVLFVQGTRDRLCPLPALEEVRSRMCAPSALHVVEEGDHSLQVTRRWLRAHDLTQDHVDGRILEAVDAFFGEHVPSACPTDAG